MISRAQSRWIKRCVILMVLAAGVGYASYHNSNNQPAGETPIYETAKVSRDKITQVVTASGQLNPVLKVEVGSQISGIIQNLFADFNSIVKKGQLVAQIDPGTYLANFTQAEGNLLSAKAALKHAQHEEARARKLRDDKLTSQADYDIALVNLQQAEATVKINEGTLKKAQVDLDRCEIYAPIDGIVISRDVNVGQTVAASLSAPKLFVIANDLAKMQIEAKVSEADIGRIQPGQEVKFTVDAFPDDKFRGKVTQVRNLPVVDSTVVMYDTIIEVSNPDLKLKPGMTANVGIIVAERKDVLKIPNAALRFRPPKDVKAVKIELPETPGPNEQQAEGSKSKKDKKKSGSVVYALRDGRLHSIDVSLGIGDGRDTEVIAGLNEGEEIVVEMSEPEKSESLMSRLMAVMKPQD